MNQIPILINRKGSLEGDLAFKIFPLERKVTISHRRQKTFDSIEKPNYQQRKHDTLDPKKIRGESRYRRISSSGGANKFPKDFFNQNLPRTPIKIRFSRSKKEYLQQSQSILKPANNDSKQYKLHYQYLKRCVQSPQKNFETIIQVETPKFNHKEINEDDFFQTKSKTTNKKMKVEEYLSHKKQSFPAFFKLTKQATSEEVNQAKPNNFQTKVFKQNPNSENEILLETLGKKQNLLKQAAEQGKKRKRISSNMEKQNLHQPLFTNKNKKSIKAFLSTKGLNWKILQKINGMKSQPEDKKQNEIFKVKQLRQPVNLKSNNGLSQKFEQNERNTFRIRKFA